MKHLLLIEILRKFGTNPQLRRKLKIVFAVVFVCCLATGTLVIWGGISAFKSIAAIGTSPVVQEKILRLETTIENAPALVQTGCWETVKSLMNVEVWIEKPIAESYSKVKSACLNE